jgi:branched-chain amino acid transport system substrate-binding protein
MKLYSQEGRAGKTESSENIKIGLLFSGEESGSSVKAAELAIHVANRDIVLDGRSFELVKRSTDGPWGIGSKQAVNFIFQDEVRAILGCVDGRNAHLAEQVSVKAETVLLSARATDPTLSQAYVPWYFRCVPNDNQQAEALFREISKKNDKDFFLVGDAGYDAGMAIDAVIRQTRRSGKPDPEVYLYDSADPDYGFIKQIASSPVNNLLLTGMACSDLNLLEQLGEMREEMTIFCTLPIIDQVDIEMLVKAYPEGTILVYPGFRFTGKGPAFEKEFYENYNSLPDATAAYVYDGMILLMEAVRRVGPDRGKIRKFLAGEEFPDCVTGTIRFDEMGNRRNAAELMIIRNGQLVEFEKNE